MTREEALTFAPVLEHMIDLLAADGRLKFGDALKQAMAKCKLTTIPQHVEGALLTAACRVIMTRGIPDAADA